MESLTCSIGENFFFSDIQPYLRDTMCSQILLNSHLSNNLAYIKRERGAAWFII